MGWKDDLNYGLAAFGLKVPDSVPLDEWAAGLSKSPCRNTAAVVATGALLFYAAERGRNPKVNDVWDALVYCSTCLSVGYGDIFAKTPMGKILGSALMTMGPSLADRTLDGPAPEDAGGREAVQTEILNTLRQILLRLEQQQHQSPAPAARE